MFRTPWSFRVLLARYGKNSINYLDRSGVGQQAGKSIELCQDMLSHSVNDVVPAGEDLLLLLLRVPPIASLAEKTFSTPSSSV